jgi:hypothetical protein
MQKAIYALVVSLMLLSCNKLNISPDSIVQDKDVFSSPGGVASYMAGLYSRLPVEDFKYSSTEGFNVFNFINNVNTLTGEGINKNVGGMNNGSSGYWQDAYIVIRNANYFLETMPQYAPIINNPVQVNAWLGEARFIRSFTYFALVKRYGGVPLISTVQNYPRQSIDELQVPRSSEQEVYDFIGADLDSAISLLGATSEARGRANRFTAAALKSRAMLFAGSIAKYNTRNFTDPNTNKSVQGIPAIEATRYFKASYDAALMVQTGGYTLYRSYTNKVDNYYNLFFDVTSGNRENIFVKEYNYPDVVHSYDVFAVPSQLQGANGYSSYICPTLDYVELFDGLPKNADGSLKLLDENNKYLYFDNRYNLFENAEPRFLATVIVPGATFKGQLIDIRRGIHTGDISNGITKMDNYNGIRASTNKNGDPTVDIGNGQTLKTGGASGVYGSRDAGTICGFFVRKYSDEKKPTSEVLVGRCAQPWIEMRYAEVLLNRAEAAYELYAAGRTDANYQQDAYTCINDIRDRAGAVLLGSPADLNDINIIRKERRKELGFENKIWWDIKRWRTADSEINNRVWYVLNPIYVAANGKYIFDRRLDERNARFTFQPLWYYEPIPGGEINKNPKLVQNQ